MILALDVGNTNIVLGCMTNEEVYFTARLSTNRCKTSHEYAVLIRDICGLRNINLEKVEGGIISSVVPELSEVLRDSVEMIIGTPPLIVGSSAKADLTVCMDHPNQLGSDLAVDAIAAIAEYPKPILIFDMGTATTVSAIDTNSCYQGGMIIPGVMLTLEAVASRTSQLPHVSLDKPKQLVGKNTVDCMKSGIVYGNAAMIDGIIDRMEEEFGQPLTVLATGGVAKTIIPFCKKEIIYDDTLLLKGLRILYQQQKRTISPESEVIL